MLDPEFQEKVFQSREKHSSLNGKRSGEGEWSGSRKDRKNHVVEVIERKKCKYLSFFPII
jgi:hypothetical protein